MKSEDEIREKIKELKKLRDAHDFGSIPYYRCSAGVNFLEWVLETQKMIKYRQAIEQIGQIVEFAIEETLTLGQKNATDKILEIIRAVQDDEN